MTHIFLSIKESLTSVLPIAIIVLVLSVTCVSLDAGVLVLFLFGTILLILGMSFFTVGSTISMEPLGDGIGKSLTKSKWLLLSLLICGVLGFLITVSEPDLQVLAQQVPTIPNAMLIGCVGVGVGAFAQYFLQATSFNNCVQHNRCAYHNGGVFAVCKGVAEVLENVETDEDREILIILAPLKTSRQIMEDVNREFGINSKANGIITAIPTEKAYKI